jgi:hypothetical protein
MKCSQQLSGGKGVRLHPGLELVAAPTLRKGWFQVEGIQGENVTVRTSGWRAGTVVACVLEVVHTVGTHTRNLLGLRNSLG